MNHERIIGKEKLGKGIKLSDIERAKAAKQKITIQGLDGNKLKLSANPDSLLRVNEGHQYWFEATLDLQGLLELDIQNEVDGRKSNNIFPAQLIQFALEGWGDRVKVIHGYWVEGTNFELFHVALRAGKSSEEAALSTWTGQVLSSLGFSQVSNVKIGSVNRSIHAYFRRPTP